MDERVKKLKTPKHCKTFAVNALKKDRPDLAKQAKEREIQLKAEAHGASVQAEIEALEAIYAYEEVLSIKNGKQTRASRTWPMIEKYGIIKTVEKIVSREAETQGYLMLSDMGLKHYAFEAVVLRHPHLFDQASIATSRRRLDDLD